MFFPSCSSISPNSLLSMHPDRSTSTSRKSRWKTCFAMSKGVFTPSLLRLLFVTVLPLQSLLLPSIGSSLELLLEPAVGTPPHFRAALAGLRGVEGRLSMDSEATSRAPGPAKRLRGEGRRGGTDLPSLLKTTATLRVRVRVGYRAHMGIWCRERRCCCRIFAK